MEITVTADGHITGANAMIYKVNPYGHSTIYYPQSDYRPGIKKKDRKVEAISKSKSVIIDIKGKQR